LQASEAAKQGKGFEDILTRKDQWHQHKNADVAAYLLWNKFPYEYDPIPMQAFIDRHYEYSPVGLGGPKDEAQLKLYVTQVFSTSHGGVPVQLGDDLFFVGLFVQSAGDKKNLPIARFGNLSRMPGDELISIESLAYGKVDIRAYLVELHSWGGHSGSPVFWHHAFNVKAATQDSTAAVVDRQYVIGLLGLVTGHFDIVGEAEDKQRDTLDDIRPRLNAGMAIITPAENIRELLMNDDEILKERGERLEQILAEKPVGRTDKARVPSDSPTQRTLAPLEKDRIEIPVPSKGEVMDVFKKATRKRDKK